MKEKLKTQKLSVGADDPTVYDESVRRNVGADDPVCPLPQRNTLKKQTGITLIALIISIIVMLILAAVSINIIMNQGIITKSQDAANTHKIAAEKEAIELAYSKYLTEKHNGEPPTLTIADSSATVTGNEESGWTITYANGNVYTLSKNGGIEGPTTGGNTGGAEGTEVDMEVALQSFTANPQNYVHPEQSSTNKDRAIGTDGKAVNMDLWTYIVLNEDNSEIALAENIDGSDGLPAYSNNEIVNGKIKGTVPQYIYVEEGNKVYTVTSMACSFFGCTNLTQAPKIPSSVTDMFLTFLECSLTKAPEIPSSVRNMMGTFYECTSLTQAPEIPSSVRNMMGTFYECTKLTGTIRINATNIDCLDYCFDNITNNITVQVPANSTTYNTFNAEYGSSSNITIETF